MHACFLSVSLFRRTASPTHVPSPPPFSVNACLFAAVQKWTNVFKTNWISFQLQCVLWCHTWRNDIQDEWIRFGWMLNENRKSFLRPRKNGRVFVFRKALRESSQSNYKFIIKVMHFRNLIHFPKILNAVCFACDFRSTMGGVGCGWRSFLPLFDHFAILFCFVSVLFPSISIHNNVFCHLVFNYFN